MKQFYRLEIISFKKKIKKKKMYVRNTIMHLSQKNIQKCKIKLQYYSEPIENLGVTIV